MVLWRGENAVSSGYLVGLFHVPVLSCLKPVPLGSKKVGFVEAAGSAQAEVMKDNHVTPEFPWGGAPWGGRGKGARVYGKGTWHGKGAWQGKGGFPGECWECGKPGHRSADCSATP